VNQFRATPLMVDGLVYVSTALGQVAALGAGTGELAWSCDPRSYERIDPSETVGWQH
jgi:glucose dehydrogenase